MRQLQLFTSAELAGMRDRTASRSYSPERDQFRREHERHRAWGLIQRHGQRVRHLRNSACAPRSATTPEHHRQDHAPAPAPAPAQAPAPVQQEQCPMSTPLEQRHCPALSRPARGRDTPTDQEPAYCRGTPAGEAEPASKGRALSAGAGHDTVHDPAESPRRIVPGSNGLGSTESPPPRHSPAPLESPALLESRGSGRHAETIRSGPRCWPRPPRRHYRRPLRMPAGGLIDATPRPTIHHPDMPPERPRKARGPPAFGISDTFPSRICCEGWETFILGGLARLLVGKSGRSFG
jgi:hypothetical protein